MTSVEMVSPHGEELVGMLPGRLLGLSGAPGVGKSTVARWLGAVVVPMDGFHLPDAELARRGLLDVKGAPETFDAEGYAGLLARIAAGEPVRAPAFEHAVGASVEGAIEVPPTGLVVTEGNYLLLPEQPWPRARAQCDEIWHLVVDEELRHERLLRRAVASGRSPADARAWVDRVDAANAARVEAAAADAAPDLVLDLTGWTPV